MIRQNVLLSNANKSNVYNLNNDITLNIRNIFLRYQYNISYPLELELILATTLYITKSDMIYRDVNNKNIIFYYLLRNVEIL